MKSFWLTFTDGSTGCCQGANEYDAKQIAQKLTGKKVKAEGDFDYTYVQQLPYPANPIIWQLDHPVSGKCPAFCYKPRECVGRGSCPQRISCTE